MTVGHLDDFPVRNWDLFSSVTFRKTNDVWGGFSNMCGGFPIVVDGIKWFTSEALYQALRFPSHPEIQELIRGERSPMAAKMKSKPFRLKSSRDDWEQIRVDAMRWTLAAKLCANEEKFGGLLAESGLQDVVEYSHRDSFWGAVSVSEDYLQGRNVLGVLIGQLRSSYRRDGIDAIADIRPPDGSLLFGSCEFIVTPAEAEGPPSLF